eukprot:COSAG06_NODE_4351_length_4337_cov_48.628126_2_plen_182_part_00
MLAAISSRSLPSSCPRYSDLHRGLSPRLSIYPIHPAVHPSISQPDAQPPARMQSINRSISPNQSPSAGIRSTTEIAPINPSVSPITISLNVTTNEIAPINRSINPINRSVRSIDQSVNPSINQPIALAPALSSHCIHPSVNRSIDQSGTQSCNHSIDKPAAQHVSNPSGSASFHQSISPID